MFSVGQIHVCTLALTSALSWAITAWCGSKNKCHKVLRIPCTTECPVPYRVFHIIMWSIQFLIGREYISGMAFPNISVVISIFLDVQDTMYWEKSDFSPWSDKTYMCKRSAARLILTVQLFWACTARQYYICCESDMSDLLCMHDLSVWDYHRYQHVRKFCIARIWKDGRPLCVSASRRCSHTYNSRITAYLDYWFGFFFFPHLDRHKCSL